MIFAGGFHMALDRRAFFKTMGLGAAAAAVPGLSGRSVFAAPAGPGAAGISMCDWNLRGTASPDIISKASEAGLEGIQVSLGSSEDSLPLRSPAVRQKYLELGEKHGIAFNSVALGILNGIPLASEPQAAVWVIDAIEAARALGAGNILMAFFGKGDLRLRNDEGKFQRKEDGSNEFELDPVGIDRVAAALRQVVPRAEQAGVVLGIENTISARQNLEIIEKIGSSVAQVYYDVGNSWGNGYNVPAEIRMLGNDRICEVHLKDWKTPILGSAEAQVDMQQCAEALDDIGYDKWLVLETSGRKDRFIEDTRANVAFAKKTFTMA
jgi:sugar phosphate isomerase/epimerase